MVRLEKSVPGILAEGGNVFTLRTRVTRDQENFCTSMAGAGAGCFFWFFWAGGFGGTLQNEKEKFARGLLHLTVRVILCNVQAE